MRIKDLFNEVIKALDNAIAPELIFPDTKSVCKI